MIWQWYFTFLLKNAGKKPDRNARPEGAAGTVGHLCFGTFRIALKNTPRLFPPVLKGISDILAEAVREEGKEKIKIQLPDFLKPDRELFYVLSTESCICGSTALLYKNALQKIAEWLNTDLVIIPSSIHEVLVMALNEWIDIRELKDLLHEVNREEVPEKERLSDHIYLYRREQGRLEMVRNMEF